MNNKQAVVAKIVLGSGGLGVPDPEILQRRAREVAVIEGHETPNSNDWEEARRELHGRESSGVTSGMVMLGEGFLADLGREQRALELGDMESLGEELVREGIEEAEHERMFLGHFSE